jgi:peptidoglycan hydrolase-like protein with peptidoglycan-binding domain
MARLLRIGMVGQDVADVQAALNGAPSSLDPLDVDTIFGPLTRARVIEFQNQNGLSPDGIVGPLTLAALAGSGPPSPSSSRFSGFNGEQVDALQAALARATVMLDTVNTKLSFSSVIIPTLPIIDTKRKLLNIFKINLLTAAELASPAAATVFKTATGGTLPNAADPVEFVADTIQFIQLRINFATLRKSFDQQFNLVFEPGEKIRDAFVIGKDPTMHIGQTFFGEPIPDDPPAILCHERSHTVLPNMPQGVHPGTGDAPFNTNGTLVVPDEGCDAVNQDQAMINAFCYEYAVLAMQPNYDPAPYIAKRTAP